MRMSKPIVGLLLGSMAAAWACGSNDEGSELFDEMLGEIEHGIRKGLPGAMNGQADYCDNPMALCTVGEGDCDRHAQCEAPYHCVGNNGAKWGFAAGLDVCAGSHCYNKRLDAALGETQIDCGGNCGPICPMITCPPSPNGTIGHCTADCRCPAGEGDCNANGDCQAGLVCGNDVGPKFGMPTGYDVCVDPTCLNGQLDAPNETGVDCGGTCGACPPSASFTGLGDLAGGTFFSEPNAVSNNGLVVVGTSNSTNGPEAFRWSQSGGMVGLGDLAGGTFNSIAYGVTAAGDVVVGRGRTAAGNEAFRWTQADGMVGLGDLPGGGTTSEAWGVSAADGSVIVGPSSSTNGSEAFQWISGTMSGLGDLPEGIFSSRAYAVNAGGSIIVGRANSANGIEAFRWTSSGGMQGLGDLPGGQFISIALGISGLGGVIVGYGTTAAGTQAFRWTTSGGMVALPLPAGTTTSFAQGASSDGNTIVGTATGAENVAFVWRAATNTSVSIESVLTGAGINLAGWTLQTAVAISYDGKWVVGRGTNPSGDTEGWLAKLPF